MIGQTPASLGPVCDQDSVMEFGLYHTHARTAGLIHADRLTVTFHFLTSIIVDKLPVRMSSIRGFLGIYLLDLVSVTRQEAGGRTDDGQTTFHRQLNQDEFCLLRRVVHK